jgi:hypothetical protein
MAQSLDIFEIATVLTALLMLATVALWPFGRLRKPKRPSHCTFCNYDTNLEQAGPCSECGKPTGVASRSGFGKLAKHLRWALPAIIMIGWFTIETRHQRHAWWLLPNAAIVGLHDVTGFGWSKSLDREFQAVLVERASEAADLESALKTLQVPPIIRRTWPKDIAPVYPNSTLIGHAMSLWSKQPENELGIEVWPMYFDDTVHVSWAQWHVPALELGMTTGRPESTAHVQISFRVPPRRSIFNFFKTSPIPANIEGKLTAPIERCESLNELVESISGPLADQAITNLLRIRVISLFDQGLGVSVFPGVVSPLLEHATLGLQLNVIHENRIVGQSRFVLRLGEAGSSIAKGLQPEELAPLKWFARDLEPQNILIKPTTRFQLMADPGMVLSDPLATRYWHGEIDLDGSDILRTAFRRHLDRIPAPSEPPPTPPSLPAADSPAP